MTMDDVQHLSSLNRLKDAVSIENAESFIRPRGRGASDVLAPLDHQDDDRDEQGVNDQGFDQDKPEDQQEADVRGAARVPRNALAGAADGLGLAEGAGGHGQRDDGRAGDQRNLEQRGLGRAGDPGVLRQERRREDRGHEKQDAQGSEFFGHDGTPFHLMFFFVGDGPGDIDAGEQDEHERLDDGCEDGHGHEREGQEEGDDGGHDDDEQFLGEDIPE